MRFDGRVVIPDASKSATRSTVSTSFHLVLFMVGSAFWRLSPAQGGIDASAWP